MAQTLKYVLVLAVALAATSALTACGKKGSLEKPVAKTEQPKKKSE
jgi:predicted small lipoprotein YifL